MTALNAPSVDSLSSACSTCASATQAIRSLSAAVQANLEALTMTKDGIKILSSIVADILSYYGFPYSVRWLILLVQGVYIWHLDLSSTVLTESLKIPSLYGNYDDIKSPITVFNKDGSFSSFDVRSRRFGSSPLLTYTKTPGGKVSRSDVHPATLPVAVSTEADDDGKSVKSHHIYTKVTCSDVNPSAFPIAVATEVDDDGKPGKAHTSNGEVTRSDEVDDDRKSVKSYISVSTDWEKEYGVDPSIILQESLGDVPTTVDVETTSARAQRAPPEERCQNVAGNVEGIPGNVLLGCETEIAGRTIFDEALDKRRVIKVTMTTTEEVLTRNDM
ncbi:hypothetical protein H0H93_010893 [Arthromyces matolae]|nr:hypothetical protein H0H93_010893 [Arthromyces matolae]